MATVSALKNSNADVPATMRAAVYRGINDVRVENVPVPEIGEGEVLVRIRACGVCGTDLKKIHTGSHTAPRIFGHEMAGEIVAVGEGVQNWKVGDRVMAFHHSPCGQCYYCRKKTFAQCESYKKVGCTAGFEPSGGGFAEYIRVMAWIVQRGLVRIPENVAWEQAAWIEPVNTCFKAIRNLQLEADETVLVIGQGPIGILLGSLAHRTGATVLTSDLYPSRHAVAAQFGLDHPIHAGEEDVLEAVKRQTARRGADVTIVAVGGNALIRSAMDAVRPGGRILLFAATQHGEAVIDPAAVCMDEKTLLGSYSSSVDIQEEAAQLVLDGYHNGFDLTRLISHRYPLERAAEAIAFASEPKPDSMKIMIQP
ncbi:MAG TPA: zinc-dependent dehydrogenase [Acidobacteriaceae bacterium]|nr:zinc-dependent dehydrogenase [Acidobacteriaceae bacterium]